MAEQWPPVEHLRTGKTVLISLGKFETLLHPHAFSPSFTWDLFQVENRYHSAGRARRFFHSVTRDNDSLVPRLFAIVAEQQRKQLVDAAQR